MKVLFVFLLLPLIPIGMTMTKGQCIPGDCLGSQRPQRFREDLLPCKRSADIQNHTLDPSQGQEVGQLSGIKFSSCPLLSRLDISQLAVPLHLFTE